MTWRASAMTLVLGTAVGVLPLGACANDRSDAVRSDVGGRRVATAPTQTTQGPDPCGEHSTSALTLDGRQFVRDLTGVLRQSETPTGYRKATGSIACR